MLLCSSVVFFFQFSFFNVLNAQHSVAPVLSWLATVDDSQRIVLSWSPSADSTVWGYHICSGQPCLDYDTVFGRLDTSLLCLDHSPLEPHSYRIHVFDSSHNVSSLTPAFGNIVLSAEVPECETAVHASWTPYGSMPSGLGRYLLMVRVEPLDTLFETYYSTDSSGARSFSFSLPPEATSASLRVAAVSVDRRHVSFSNTVAVQRLTADTAAFLDIRSIAFDSLAGSVNLSFRVDIAYRGADSCTLWRSVDGSPWRQLARLPWPPLDRYADRSVSRYDSLHCYQLSVADACGLGLSYSESRCVVVPPPPPPAVALPNIVVVGADSPNGQFLPVASSLMGDIYELCIYDRRGNLVFATTDPAEPWRPDTGTPQGSYAYSLRLRFADNTIHSYAGTILVIR